MVQNILNDTDSDPVNSIDDTVEAAQVAEIIKTTYFAWMSNGKDWPFLRTLSTFTGLADTTTPTKMQMPEGMGKIFWVKYNGVEVTYLPPKDFHNLISSRVETTGVVDANGYVINADPVYWTTYDDNYVWFDGYDSDVESTLVSANCEVYAVVAPTWTASDSFVPTLPEKMFPTLLADAKGTAFLVLKQQANAKEEAVARRGKVKWQREAARANEAEPRSNTGVSYGRK